MGKQGSSQKQRSSQADTCRSPSGTPSDAETEHFRSLLLHLERDTHIPLSLINPILSDIASTCEELAALALRSLGYILHHENIVAAFSDDCALAVLNSLLELITSTDQKALCSLGVWCLGIQEFGVPLLETQIYLILQAIVHAIDNPMGSKAVTYEALQAVVKMVHKVPKMRSAASVWAPPVYRRLLSTDKRDRDMSERCLKDMEMFLLPPTSSLSKVVALDINQTLLSIMEKMVKSRALVVPTIRAWSWLVRLLGSQAGENRVLVNQMLKVAEVTFTSDDPQVQIASLVAWEALIDALFQYPALQSDELQQQTDTVSPSSENFRKLSASPSVKRLKLLMVPLITIMSGASLQSVRLACWRTWTYLSHKLDFGINSLPVQAVVVTPMFEVIFKSGPEKGTLGVWDLCLNALEALIACKFQDKLDLCSTGPIYIGLEGRVSSPKTPTLSKPTENEVETLPIKWVPWSIESLELILNLIRVLWLCGVKNLKQSSSDNLSLNGAIRMLYLVIRGIDGEGKGTVKPSMENVKSVHAVLKLVSELYSESELLAEVKEPVSILWPAFEVMLEFGYLVLSSSFYKLSFLQADNQLKDGNSLSPLNILNPKEAVCMPTSSGDLITPIAYIIAMWIQVGCALFCNNEEEAKALEILEKLAECTKAGHGIMNNLQGVGVVLDWFFSHVFGKALGVQENFLATDVKAMVDTTMVGSQLFNKGYYFLVVWKIFACQLASYIESSNDVPAVESGIGDSGYQVVHKFLLLPVQFCLKITDLEGVSQCHSSHKDTECVRLSQSSNELDLVVAAWTRLYDCSSRVSSLKSSQPNSFANAYCQKVLKLLKTHTHCVHNGRVDKHALGQSCLSTDMLGSVAKHVLRQTDISSLATLAINRKKRLGSFIGGSCPSNGVMGNDIGDTSNVRDILCLISRMLELSWNELIGGKTCWFSPASRVLAALAGFVTRLYTQQDALIFLQDFSRPFAKWLSSSDSSLIKQITCPSSEVLWQALQDLWEKLLSFLQRCQPPLTYNSNLLSLQAPLLIPAFQHSKTPISNSTLAFWQATYGSKASFLKYPPCLVPVLQQLKEKVKIFLPGWEKNLDHVLKGRTEADQFSELDLETPTGGRKQLQMLKERSLERKRNSLGMMTSTDPKSKLDKTCKSINLCNSNFRQNIKAKATDKPVDAVLEKIKRPVGKSHAFAVSTGVADTGLNNVEDTIYKSKDAPISTSIEQSKHRSKNAVLHKKSRGEKSDQIAEGKEMVEGVACMYSEAVQTIKEPHQMSAPNVATSVEAGGIPVLQGHNASTEPRENLALPCHYVQSVDCRTFLHKAKNNSVLGSEWDLEAPARRKKLRFLGDDSLEYTPIPLSQKKAGPLTDHQKEVRLAQSGTIGSECTSHGAGIKTYTYMDFSQSQIVFDSEDPDEVPLEVTDQVLKDDGKLKDLDNILLSSTAHLKQSSPSLSLQDGQSRIVHSSIIVRSPEKVHNPNNDAPSELTLAGHNIKLPNEIMFRCRSAVKRAEQKPVLQKGSLEVVEGLESVTPFKTLGSSRKLNKGISVADSDVYKESNLTVSCSEGRAATTCCEIPLANALVSSLRSHEVGGNEPVSYVPHQVIVCSELSHEKCNKRQPSMNNLELGLPHKGVKELQYEQGETRLGLSMHREHHDSRNKELQSEQGEMQLGSNKYSVDHCKPMDNGNTFLRCGSPRSSVHDCMEQDSLEGQTQPVIVETQQYHTQICSTQPCDTQMLMESDDKECNQVTTVLMQQPKSDEDIAKQIGIHWAVCDLLTAASSSSHWNNMDLESLECAQKLITVLQRQVHKSRKRLFAEDSP